MKTQAEPASGSPIANPSLAGQRVLVMGLGRFGGGVGVTRWLCGQRAAVTVTDQADAATLTESIADLGELPLALHLGGHDVNDLDAADLVIVNPAVVKSRSSFFQEIIKREIPWTTEMNLFCERCPAEVIGITGTYGKSTTCAMLAEALESCGRNGNRKFRRVHLGGNIGRSLLSDQTIISKDDVVVLEMSNAQLEDLPRIAWAPSLAVITNLFPHHLDRHATAAAYFSAKLNIIHRDHMPKIIVGPMHAEAEAQLRNLVADDNEHLVRVGPIDPPLSLRVPGKHNQANAACVMTVCVSLGLSLPKVRKALTEFRGLPHRLESVRTLEGVDYYNDSKSTSPTATITAVQAFDRPVVVIVGGQTKDVALQEWSQSMMHSCRQIICMGEAGTRFAAALRSITSNQSVAAVHKVDRLDQAVALARTMAKPGEIVLFSPGAPSFDSYPNFVERGKHFAGLIEGL